jgi:hypothetical protein
MSNAVLSNIAVDIAEKCGVSAAAFIKNAAIAYETVFFYPGIFGRIEGLDLSDMPTWVAEWSLNDAADARDIARSSQFRAIFPDARDLWVGLDNFNPYREIDLKQRRHDERLLFPIRQIVARTYNVSEQDVSSGKCGDTWYNIPSFVAQDLAVLMRLREIDTTVMGVFTEAHITLFAEDIYRQGITGDPLARLLIGDPQALSVFPDFSSLSWDEIIELRAEPTIRNFRQKLTSLATGDFRYDRSTWQPLWKEYIQGLEVLATEVAPKPIKAGIMGILGNFPVPFPNPISLLASGLSFVEEADRARDYGWLYFVQTAKNIRLRSPYRSPPAS